MQAEINPKIKISAYWPILIILLLVFTDQWIKVYVKTHFLLGEEKWIFKHWFKIYFIENDGMAFGLKLPGMLGKYTLTIFRMVVSIFGAYFLVKSIRTKAAKGLLVAIAMVLAGAIGNIIDSVFYGKIFGIKNEYLDRGWFQGQVVDMFQAPLFNGHFPKWIPVWGGEPYTFFSPIWNFADACITIGVVIILFGQKKFFAKDSLEPVADGSENTELNSQTILEHQNTHNNIVDADPNLDSPQEEV